MIPLAGRPKVPPIAITIFTLKLFCFVDIVKSGNILVQTDNKFENINHYRRVDQKFDNTYKFWVIGSGGRHHFKSRCPKPSIE